MALVRSQSLNANACFHSLTHLNAPTRGIKHVVCPVAASLVAGAGVHHVALALHNPAHEVRIVQGGVDGEVVVWCVGEVGCVRDGTLLTATPRLTSPPIHVAVRIAVQPVLVRRVERRLEVSWFL